MIRIAVALGLSQSGFHAFIASMPLAMVAVGRPDGEIGAIMGTAAIFTIVGALACGGMIDRYGGRTVYLAGTGLLAIAALLMAAGLVRAESDVAALVVVRGLQGVGLAAVLPALASLVPGMVSQQRVPTALAFVGVAANLSLAVTPPASLFLLQHGSLQLVGVATLVATVLGMVMLYPLADVEREARARTPGDRPHTFRPKWRPAWTGPLLISFLFVAHWGVVTGYLPQRAEAAGADIALFFTGDAIALLICRVPAGWLAGRIGTLPLVLAGVVITTLALTLLLLPITTLLLVLAGIGTGAGGAMAMPTMMIELSHRSDATDRGSAFGLYSVAFGAGISLGSIGVAPFYAAVGFEVVLAVGIVMCAAAGGVALFDRAMRHPPMDSRQRDEPIAVTLGG